MTAPSTCRHLPLPDQLMTKESLLPLCPETGIGYDRAGPTSPTGPAGTTGATGPDGARPVVLLHAGVADRRMWEPQWQRLTREYDVLRIDLRGFGESTQRLDRFAHHQDVAQTLQALGITRAHLVGCSLGAGVAVEVALAAPGLVASLLLVTPGGSLIPEMTPELRRFARAENEALEAEDLDAAVQANLDWWVDGPRRGADPAREEMRSGVAGMQRRAFEITWEWDDVEEVELDPPALDRLEEIAVPTLVLSSDLDLDAIGHAVEQVTTRVPGARHTSWPDTAHLPSLERPDRFTDLVEEWFGRP